MNITFIRIEAEWTPRSKCWIFLFQNISAFKTFLLVPHFSKISNSDWPFCCILVYLQDLQCVMELVKLFSAPMAVNMWLCFLLLVGPAFADQRFPKVTPEAKILDNSKCVIKHFPVPAHLRGVGSCHALHWASGHPQVCLALLHAEQSLSHGEKRNSSAGNSVLDLLCSFGEGVDTLARCNTLVIKQFTLWGITNLLWSVFLEYFDFNTFNFWDT